VVKPAGRKQIVDTMVQEHQLSERTACQLAGISRTAYRYKAKRRDDERLRVRLKELAVKQSAYGYLLLHGMLKAEGLVVNRKGFKYALRRGRSSRGLDNQWKYLLGLISVGQWILSLTS
jgi:hypothetical protein